MTTMDGLKPLDLPSKYQQEPQKLSRYQRPESTGEEREDSSQYQQSTSTDKEPEKDQRHKQYWFVQSGRNVDESAKTSKNKWMRIGTESRISCFEIMRLDQAGPATIAQEEQAHGRLLAIKRMKPGTTDIRTIKMVHSDFVVSILDCFWDHSELVVISEQMDVSLRHINGVVPALLKASEIAAICKDVRSTTIDMTLLTISRY